MGCYDYIIQVVWSCGARRERYRAVSPTRALVQREPTIGTPASRFRVPDALRLVCRPRERTTRLPTDPYPFLYILGGKQNRCDSAVDHVTCN